MKLAQRQERTRQYCLLSRSTNSQRHTGVDTDRHCCARDQNILVNEQKVERYQDLALEIKRIHRVTKETE